MSLIAQKKQLEKIVLTALKSCQKSQVFACVPFWQGWGECVRQPSGDYKPTFGNAPALEVVAQLSAPVDTDGLREITLRVTLATGEDETKDTHEEREALLDTKLCTIQRGDGDTHTAWRWEAARLNEGTGERITEWTVIIRVDDPCWEC